VQLPSRPRALDLLSVMASCRPTTKKDWSVPRWLDSACETGGSILQREGMPHSYAPQFRGDGLDQVRSGLRVAEVAANGRCRRGDGVSLGSTGPHRPG
jgi:hypothetical protein